MKIHKKLVKQKTSFYEVGKNKTKTCSRVQDRFPLRRRASLLPEDWEIRYIKLIERKREILKSVRPQAGYVSVRVIDKHMAPAVRGDLACVFISLSTFFTYFQQQNKPLKRAFEQYRSALKSCHFLFSVENFQQ